MQPGKTLQLSASSTADLDRAAGLLRDGATVAFPTETVYGLGANALFPDAVAAIFAAKQRPSWDPLIVHVASYKEISKAASIPSEIAARVESLAAEFWPGPLTLLLPRAESISPAVTAGRDLVGVRIPAHPVAQALLRAAGVPVAAPSANTFGHVSPTTAAHVLADLDGRIDAVVDGGATTVGVESTVLDPRTMTLYRPGGVTAEQIAAVTGILPALFVPAGNAVKPESLPSPGVGIRHYAPRARLVLVDGTSAALAGRAAAICSAELGIMLPSGWTVDCPQARTFDWGEWENPETLAVALFRGLRELDAAGVAIILCPLPPPHGVGAALVDRLTKAARLR